VITDDHGEPCRQRRPVPVPASLVGELNDRPERASVDDLVAAVDLRVTRVEFDLTVFTMEVNVPLRILVSGGCRTTRQEGRPVNMQ
jgi:hypothetical protein